MIAYKLMRPVIAYKLMRQRKDGSLGPLFINRGLRLHVGELYPAEDHPTKGYAHRPGWHAAQSVDHAPHLKLKEDRVWVKVWLDDVETVERPASQGGHWYLAGLMRPLEVL